MRLTESLWKGNSSKMMSNNIEALIAKRTEQVEKSLLTLASEADFTGILDVAKYSLMSGGKRLRPFIVLEAYRLFSGSDYLDVALPVASALEMIHTYSLIHDDLPCMDNDDYRRGRLTSHKVYGEAKALLAGDTLLTYAFEVLSNAEGISDKAKINCIKALSKYAGYSGMAGGQMIDLESQVNIKNMSELIKMHSMKTSALIICALEMGYYLACDEVDLSIVSDLDKVGYNIGVAFQIVDDILDKISESKVLGKEIGSDEKNGKTTTLTYLDIKEAKNLVNSLSSEAIELMKKYTSSYDSPLVQLITYLIDRKK